MFIWGSARLVGLVGQLTTEEGARSTDLVKHHIRLNAGLPLVMSTTKEVLVCFSE